MQELKAQFSFQKLHPNLCKMGPSIVVLHEVVLVDE